MKKHDTSGLREPRRPRVQWLLLSLVASAVVTSTQTWNAAPRQQDFAVAGLTGTLGARLSPTLHPVVPVTLDSMWYVPTKADTRVATALANLARGVRLLEETGDATTALPLVGAAALANTDVAPYAKYYTGLALQKLNRLEEAEAAFASVAAQKIEGHLPEAAAFRQAEVREARRDYSGAQAIHEQLVQRKTATPHIAWLKLGMMAESAGNRARAVEAFHRVLQEFPLTSEAAEAELGLERVNGFALESPEHVARELVRAEALFKARRIAPARAAYARVRARAEGENRGLITLRLAQLDALDGKHRVAREVLRRYVVHDLYGEEAEFSLLATTLGLGDKSEYRSLARSFIAKYPSGPFTEDALSDLARHYVLEDEDGEAATVYTELANRFPAGRQTERAVWKAGWWAYRHDNFQETIRLFEQGAANFPRSDYRPSWLYWSARAYDGIGDRAAATVRYRLGATDYLNTYYGRLAWRRLEERNEATVTPGIRRALADPLAPPPTIDRIARLIELELYYPALAELQHAQKMHGDSAPLLATIALVHHKLGNLRPGIQTMKRAYPQYMTAGGEQLPTEILQVLFPLDYWPLIQYHARANGLDPYLVAALVGQESTFDADIVSSAKAIGLMQIMPATGRQYAKKLGIKPFSTNRLTEPEVNVRIGTRYFAGLVNQFGGTHFALASYNAGEHRVVRWNKERGSLSQDEFIDDIPFPETQNYVKRILGTAEDYRRLYGNGQPPSTVARPPASKPAAKSVAAGERPAAKKAATKRPSTKKPAAKKSTTTRRR